MRMWGVDPKILCNKHLLGEHVEMHMFAGCIKKGISLEGYFKNKLVCVNLLKKRHDDLAHEMVSRGIKHNTPMSEIDFSKLKYGEIDVKKNINELISRCPKCKERFDKVSVDDYKL
jgi:hypothetical protein